MWHWFFFAQPEIPQRVINTDPDSWYRADPQVMGAENYSEWRKAIRKPQVERAMLEDYRAGLTIDPAHEEADRTARRVWWCRCLCCGLSGTTSKTSTVIHWQSGETGPMTFKDAASNPVTM